MAGESTVRAEGEKVVEQIFAGSLAILSILIAVIRSKASITWKISWSASSLA
jgi:hypothetical protein